MTIPDYVVIGTITRDLLEDGFTIGGTATYAAATASRLGKRAAIVTSAEADLVLPDDLSDIQIVCAPSPATTTFRNVYVGDTRQQYVTALAYPIEADAIPADWRQVPMVHLGPLVGEFDESLVHMFPDSWVMSTPQGWFRSWDETGHISLGQWPGAERLLPHLTALILSEHDMRGDPSFFERYAASVRILVVTQGPRGATVYHAGQVRHFPTRPAIEVDPTGAGDVFAAAFLVRLYETAQASGEGDPWEAARFANIVASLSVEGLGTAAIPNRAQVQAHLGQTRQA
jgi:sugar/nucleoside kinase (ribokinase family)